jgi:hypothetical protein
MNAHPHAANAPGVPQCSLRKARGQAMLSSHAFKPCF